MTAEEPAPRSAWLALAMVSLGLFLAVVSTTVISVALPTIGQDLRASATDLEWVVDSYVLVYASLLVGGGVAGDRYGRKGLFLIGVAVFGAGALLAGLAPSIGVLLAGRTVQGLGSAILAPVSLTIIREVFAQPRQRAQAIGLWSTSGGLALAVGPPLGGFIVAGPGWRWVLLINAPLAALLVAVAAFAVPKLAMPRPSARFDWTGLVLSTGAIALLALGVIEGQDAGWAAPVVLAALGSGTAALIGFVAFERRQMHPLIDVGLFRRPAFAAANISAFVIFFAFVGAIVYFSAFFQQVQGHSAIAAGLDLSAIGIAYAASAALSGRLVGRFGERWPLITGLAVSGVATLALLTLEDDTSIWIIAPIFLVLGAGIGLCGTPMSTVAMSAVAADKAGQASAVINATRQVGQVFGVAVLGALIYSGQERGPAGGRLTGAQAAAFVDGLHAALWVAGIALLVTTAITAVLFAVSENRAGSGGRTQPGERRPDPSLTPRGRTP